MYRSSRCVTDSSSYYFEIECFNRLRAVTMDSIHQLDEYLSIYNLLIMPVHGINRKIREHAVYTRLCRLFPTLYQYDYPSYWSGLFEFYLRMYIELVISKLTAGRMPFTVVYKLEKDGPKDEPEESSGDEEVDVGP